MYEEVYDKEKDYSSNNPTNYDSTNKGKKAKIGRCGLANKEILLLLRLCIQMSVAKVEN